MNKILFDVNTKNLIVTMLIGETYISDWEIYIRHTWVAYCEKHGIGLVVIDDIIKTGNFQKPIYWQKLLIAGYLFDQLGFTGNMCFVDSDILINSNAPDIFQNYPETHIGLVSQTKNLPYPLDAIRRRLAFFRNRHLSPKYPLDSSLFASNDKGYRLHNLTPQEDTACTGFLC
jgi:hypothetical protein